MDRAERMGGIEPKLTKIPKGVVEEMWMSGERTIRSQKNAEKEKKVWLSNAMQCNMCHRKWVAVYHKNTTMLECPACAVTQHVEKILV